MSLISQLESFLFISNRPLTVRRLAELVGTGEEAVEAALADLREKTNGEERGVQLVSVGNAYQFATRGEYAKLIAAFVKEELVGEMTRPQLETLTIIAYRGPVAKSELERIRGVNCSLILRNLMIRGLVETVDGQDDAHDPMARLLVRYQVTHDFVRFLGLTSVEQLPEYEQLSKHEFLEAMKQQGEKFSNAVISE
ncbi:MAG: SMC-Scp complex subunit ScpB [Patescibacteria group bacterium]